MMTQVLGMNGLVLEGWERGKTEKGVSFYIHHGSEQTQWDHPLLVNTMEKMLECNAAKYAAYRTASKINILQKFSKLHLVSLPTIICLFDQHGFRMDQNESYMLPDELESLLTDIFHASKLDQGSQSDTERLSEISLNILLNFYDRPRNGGIKVSSAKVALTLLCSARLQEKYKYLFRQFADHNNCISKKKLLELLSDLAQIPEYLSERPSFGTPLIEAAAESCFKLESHHLGVTEESFLEWLLCEPQTLVWISTLYRLLSAESVIHDAKCSVCKRSPIEGLRYQCLRCFHYDLCQNCFFTAKTNKKHKLYHPLQEYCYKSTSREGTKALMKTIKNKLSKMTTAKSKQRYLPIAFSLPSRNDLSGPVVSTDSRDNNNRDEANSDDRLDNDDSDSDKLPQPTTNPPSDDVTPLAIVDDNDEDDEQESLHSRVIVRSGQGDAAVVDGKHRRELESIIVHLEEENRHLHNEIDKLHAASGTSTARSVADIDHQGLILARQEALVDHSHQLELQLGRLKSLLQYLQKTPQTNNKKEARPFNATKQNLLLNGLRPLASAPTNHQLESTPTMPASRSNFNNLSPIVAPPLQPNAAISNVVTKSTTTNRLAPLRCTPTNPFGTRELDQRPFDDNLSLTARRSLPHIVGGAAAGTAAAAKQRLVYGGASSAAIDRFVRGGDGPNSSFQRSSARAVLQNREFSTGNSARHQYSLEPGFAARWFGHATAAPADNTDFYTLSTVAPSTAAASSMQYTFNTDLSNMTSSGGADLWCETTETRSTIIGGASVATSVGGAAAAATLSGATSDGFDRIQAELDAIIHQLESVYPGCASQQQFHNRQKSGDRAKIIQAAGEIESMLLELVDSMGPASISLTNGNEQGSENQKQLAINSSVSNSQSSASRCNFTS